MSFNARTQAKSLHALLLQSEKIKLEQDCAWIRSQPGNTIEEFITATNQAMNSQKSTKTSSDAAKTTTAMFEYLAGTSYPWHLKHPDFVTAMRGKLEEFSTDDKPEGRLVTVQALEDLRRNNKLKVIFPSMDFESPVRDCAPVGILLDPKKITYNDIQVSQYRMCTRKARSTLTDQEIAKLNGPEHVACSNGTTCNARIEPCMCTSEDKYEELLKSLPTVAKRYADTSIL